MKNNVLGFLFPETTEQVVLNRVQESWIHQSRLRIATVNPEFLVASEKDSVFKKNLQKADTHVVDGFGLWLVLRLRGWRGERITGVALTEKLLSLAEADKRSVLVILKNGGLSSLSATKETLLHKYPRLSVTVTYENQNANNLSADLILIATGAPRQEYLAEKFQTGVVMGIGGAIDFLTGTQKRAPKLLQTCGLEWLWRLVLQPKRCTRIWNAVVVFPLLVIWYQKTPLRK